MKKFLLFSGVLVLLLFSCSTSVGIVFDNSIPIEQSAEICTYAGIITGYNGIAVNWKPILSNTVQIPAGNTLFEFDINAAYGNTIYKGNGVLFMYNFLPNKKYFLFFTRQYDEVDKKETFGLNVYTFEIGEKIPGSMKKLETHLTAFVPFLGGQGNQKTVLD